MGRITRHLFAGRTVVWVFALLFVSACFDWGTLPDKACVLGAPDVCGDLGLVCVAVDGGGRCMARTSEPTNQEPPTETMPDTANDAAEPPLPDTPADDRPTPEVNKEQTPEPTTPDEPGTTLPLDQLKGDVTLPDSHPCKTNPSSRECQCVPSHLTHVFGRMHPGKVTHIKVIQPSNNLTTPILKRLMVTADDLGNIKLWVLADKREDHEHADTKKAFPGLTLPGEQKNKLVGLHHAIIDTAATGSKKVHWVISVSGDGLVRIWEIVSLGGSYRLNLIESKDYTTTTTTEEVVSSLWADQKNRLFLGMTSGRAAVFVLNPKASTKMGAATYWTAHPKPVIGLSLHPDYATSPKASDQVLLSHTALGVKLWKLQSNFKFPNSQPTDVDPNLNRAYLTAQLGFDAKAELAFVMFGPQSAPKRSNNLSEKVVSVLAFGTKGELSVTTFDDFSVSGSKLRNAQVVSSLSTVMGAPLALVYSNEHKGFLAVGKDQKGSAQLPYRVDRLTLGLPKDNGGSFTIQSGQFWRLAKASTALVADLLLNEVFQLYMGDGHDVTQVDLDQRSGNTAPLLPFVAFHKTHLGSNTDQTRALAISPDRRWLLSVSDETYISVWDLQTMKQIQQWQVTTNSAKIVSAAFAASGQHLVIVRSDHKLGILFAGDGVAFQRQDWENPKAPLSSLKFIDLPSFKDAGELTQVLLHPKLSDVIVVGSAEGLSQMFLIVKGAPTRLRLLATLTPDLDDEEQASVDAMAFSRKGDIAVFQRMGTVQVIKWNQQKPMSNVKITNLKQPKRPPTLATLHQGGLSYLLFGGENSEPCSSNLTVCDIVWRTWDAQVGISRRRFVVSSDDQNHKTPILGLIAHPLGNWLMSIERGGDGKSSKSLLWRPDPNTATKQFLFGVDRVDGGKGQHTVIPSPLSEQSSALVNVASEAGLLATATDRQIHLWRCDSSQ